MSNPKHWYAIYTKPRWEKKVHGLFGERDIESYCPLNKVERKWSDRMKVVEEPLFKSYVFVRVSEQEMSSVRLVNGVVNFVYWLGKPAIMRDKDIETIKRFLNEYRNVEVLPLVLKPETTVLIQRGALMDKKGTVRKVLKNKVEVIIESIGYTLVAYVDKSNVSVV